MNSSEHRPGPSVEVPLVTVELSIRWQTEMKHLYVTGLLGVEPHDAWNRGDVRSEHSRSTYKTSGWVQVIADKTAVAEVERSIEVALPAVELLDGKIKSLLATTPGMVVYIGVVVAFGNPTLTLNLGTHLVERLQGLGYPLDVDLYHDPELPGEGSD